MTTKREMAKPNKRNVIKQRADQLRAERATLEDALHANGQNLLRLYAQCGHPVKQKLLMGGWECPDCGFVASGPNDAVAPLAGERNEA